MPRCLVVLAIVLASFLSSVSASAQSGQGSLNGYVKDEQGGVLPGVTVTATGPELLTPAIAVTDTSGYYRLQNLPPGLLTLTAELTGFATFKREGILMRAGSNFTVDVELKVGALEETIAVAEVKLGGVDASSPTGTSVVMNIIAPRGGNVAKGSVQYEGAKFGWNSDNTQNSVAPGGTPTSQSVNQWDASLGGPIRRNK